MMCNKAHILVLTDVGNSKQNSSLKHFIITILASSNEHSKRLLKCSALRQNLYSELRVSGICLLSEFSFPPVNVCDNTEKLRNDSIELWGVRFQPPLPEKAQVMRASWLPQGIGRLLKSATTIPKYRPVSRSIWVCCSRLYFCRNTAKETSTKQEERDADPARKEIFFCSVLRLKSTMSSKNKITFNSAQTLLQAKWCKRWGNKCSAN